MLNLLISIIALIVLIKSSGIFIDQSVALAKKIKISSFLIGFTLISLGTTLPDLVISTYSTIGGNQDVAISTFLGSSIVNMSLVLGVLALLTNYKLTEIDIDRNIPINIGIYTIFLVILALFGFEMTWIMGIISITLLAVAIFMARKNNHTIVMKSDTSFSLIFLLISFILLITAGKLCVDNILVFANSYDIAKTTIGYFVLAIGISIPELVTSFAIIKRGNLQLGLGNILGATLFDMLLVSGISSFFTTLYIKPFLEEFVFLLFATCIFMAFALLGKKYYISKKEGVGLILVYILFILIQSL